MIKKLKTSNAFLLTFCAVGVLVAGNPAWADSQITNCALVTGTEEGDSDSQVDNTTQADLLALYTGDPIGFDAASQDDEACAPVNVISMFDYGDAPDTYGTSNATANDGGAARHEIIPGLTLGAIVDDETDGVPGTEANGDETAGSPPDEDGYDVPALTAGSAVTLAVKAANTTGKDAKLVCWIDYNGDGEFATDGSESGSESGSVAVPNGTTSNTPLNVVMPQVPADVMTDTNGTSYARCRLSTDASLDATLPTGSLPDGEVEDKKVTFVATVSFDIEVINQGTKDATNIKIVDYIPAGFELNDPDWTSIENGTKATRTINPAGDELTPGTSKVITIKLKVKPDAAKGTKTNYAEIYEASDDQGNVTPDNDSTPDQVNGNDGVVSDDVTDNTDGDEDDHDLANVEVSPTVDVSLTKAVQDEQGNAVTSVRRGDTLIYVLTATNDGPDGATNVVVTDELPSGLTYVSNDGNAQFNNNKIIWTVDSLANGGTESLKITVTVD